MTQKATGNTRGAGGAKRVLIRRPYPTHTLEDALSVASAIRRANAGQPYSRELLAKSMGTTHGSSTFKMKLTSSAKYGLTEGGNSDESISLTRLGEAIVSPRGEDERRQAMMEAAVQPETFERFYRGLYGKSLPRDDFSRNMLERELGIDPSISEECLNIIKANGNYTGILADKQGTPYVIDPQADVKSPPELKEEVREATQNGVGEKPAQAKPNEARTAGGKVFVGHAGNSEAVEFVKHLLWRFGIPFGSVEGDSDDAHPVSLRVSAEMQECTSAILMLANDEGDGGNSAARMMYQVGAASALYRDRVVIMSESDGDNSPVAFRDLQNVFYRSERLEDAGLGLLMCMREAGVITVATV